MGPREPARRLGADERRRQLVAATLRLISDQGLPSITIESVAREAGITRPVVYDLFGDLDGLLDAVVEAADGRALAAIEAALPDLEAPTPPDELLDQGLRAFLESVRAEPDVWRLVLLPPDGAPRSIRGRIERRRAELAERVAEIVELAAERSGLGGVVDPAIVARLIVGIGEDMGRLTLSDPDYPPERIAAAAGRVVSLLAAEEGRATG